MVELLRTVHIRIVSDAVERIRKMTHLGFESDKILNIRSVEDGKSFL